MPEQQIGKAMAETPVPGIRLGPKDNWVGSISDPEPRAIRWAARDDRFSNPVWSKWHYTEGSGTFSACGWPVILFEVDGSPEEFADLSQVTCKRCLAKMRKAGLVPGVARAR